MTVVETDVFGMTEDDRSTATSDEDGSTGGKYDRYVDRALDVLDLFSPFT